MATLVTAVIGVAWLTLAALLLFWFASGLRKIVAESASLPFFDLLERRGLAPDELEKAIGIHEMSRAVRRCALCGLKRACRAEVSRASPARWRDDCPNAAMLVRVAQGR